MEKNHKISSGISKRTFVDYYSKSPELSNILTKIFEKFDTDGGGTVSWEEYLDAMHVIWHGTIEDQLDFFFSVYDDDGNGCLSFKEIQELCRLQLQMDKADGLLDELSYSFASLIFDLTETSYTEDVPSYKIKEIIRKQQDKSLIEMFCSFNCLK
jgi:Ca2+-binding EF-hand superfamily protein